MKKIFNTLFCMVLVALQAAAQVPQPASPQSGSILLTGGTAHLGDGTVIENAVISIVDGKLGMVADATTVRVDASQFDEQMDISGKHVYPGLILPNTTLGLVEVNAVRATRDFAEVGGVNPNVRSLIAYNTDSELIATLRFNGILLAQATPRGGVVS
ncbi:MAG: amidohydrolase, partial [Bacteroidota bacterium]